MTTSLAPSGPTESVTICLTCRDEEGNIEPLVRAIPRLSSAQEILFVEGHSIDGTRAEIERCIQRYPERNIRLIGQPGIGQGDAIRAGFGAANGEILILLEADMTSPPEEVRGVFEAIRNGSAGFVEGTRFARPMPAGAMPLPNRLGNRLFALWFSWLLGQQLTDVLAGIKGLRKIDFDRIEESWGGWGIDDPFGDFELLLGAARLGLRIVELPIAYRSRQHGRSKTRVLRHGALLCRIAFRASLRKSR